MPQCADLQENHQNISLLFARSDKLDRKHCTKQWKYDNPKVGKGAKTILSLRDLVQSKGRWQQFWDKIQQYGTQAFI